MTVKLFPTAKLKRRIFEGGKEEPPQPEILVGEGIDIGHMIEFPSGLNYRVEEIAWLVGDPVPLVFLD
jgi:hypothetical protein